jgi:hypothetical protein
MTRPQQPDARTIMYPDDVALASHENETAVASRPSDAEKTDPCLILSFEELFERHHALVFRLLYRILGDREEALDVS